MRRNGQERIVEDHIKYEFSRETDERREHGDVRRDCFSMSLVASRSIFQGSCTYARRATKAQAQPLLFGLPLQGLRNVAKLQKVKVVCGSHVRSGQ